MEDRRYIELARLIIEKTNERKVSWQPSSSNHTYQAIIGMGAVLVYLDLYANNGCIEGIESPIGYISFLNNRRESIHNITVFNEDDENFAIIQDLYNQARESYLNTDETIKSMFDELENNLPF